MQAKISYQTLHLPPPFAYAYTLEFRFNHKLHVTFQLEYLNRDVISQEEIELEGFTEFDDFQWTGYLNPAWINALKQDLVQAKTVSETDSETTWIHLETDSGKAGVLRDMDEWDYRLQEVIQAIYEEAGREKPLLMKFVHRQNGQNSNYNLTASFASRLCTVNDRSIPWQQMQTLLSEVFSMDFGETSANKPDQDGLWIDPDGASGYYHVRDLAGRGSEKLEKRILELLK